MEALETREFEPPGSSQMSMRFPPSLRALTAPTAATSRRRRMLRARERASLPIDHALTLLLAGEIDAAMRWAAAALERAPSPSALLVTCRLLDQMGRTRAAVDGLKLAVRQSVDRGNLPLAVAAIDDLRVLGVDVGEHLDSVASTFCRGSSRLHRGEAPPLLPPLPAQDFVQPLSPFLAGPALASKATQIVQEAKHRYEDALGEDLPRVLPLPLFSALSKGALRDVLSVFRVVTVPAGQRVILEGEECSEAYVVVRGEVEISRGAAHGDNKFTLALSRLGGGAFFGEMALLSLMPSPASATATRPSILLSARREALVDIAANRPEIAGQLAAHCRRNSLANLGWTSPVVAAVPPVERASLVERLEMRIFDKGDRLVQGGEESPGLHLIVSGEVAIVAKEWGERVLLATLGAGETVGEMELVLCRQPFADAVATRSTATLFLSRDEYSSLIQDHPAILHGLYAIAVQRQAETSFALKSGSAVVADDWLLDASGFDGHAERSPRAAPESEPAAPSVSSEPARAFATASTIAAPAPIPASVRPSPPPREPIRTLPLPPPPRPAWPPPSSSLRPTATSVQPSNAGHSRGWFAPAAAAAFAAVAASAMTILASRGQSPATPASVSAARPPSAAENLPSAQPPADTETPSAVAAASHPAIGAVPAAAPSSTAAAPKLTRAPTPVVPASVAPARKEAPTPAAPAAVATAARVVAVSATPAPVRATGPAPQVTSASAADDEFGGRQ